MPSKKPEARGWSTCPECDNVATLFEGGIISCDTCPYEHRMARGPSYDIYDECPPLATPQGLPEGYTLHFDSRPISSLKEHEHDNTRASRECLASTSGNCLREAESETACDTEAGECVHGHRPGGN